MLDYVVQLDTTNQTASLELTVGGSVDTILFTYANNVISFPARNAFDLDLPTLERFISVTTKWLSLLYENFPEPDPPYSPFKYSLEWKTPQNKLYLDGKVDGLTFSANWAVGTTSVHFDHRQGAVFTRRMFRTFVNEYKELLNAIHAVQNGNSII